jgi:ribosomal protein S12 methylthiotransferase
VKRERQARFMERQAVISERKLAAKIGRTIDVIIDDTDEDGGAEGRSMADAPEIDGVVHLRADRPLRTGDIVRVDIEDADEHDLYGTVRE